MKILHSSDWHLGHHLYGHDRTEEQNAMIECIAGIAAEEKPDVFLLCGDVYDVAQPSAATQALFVRAMVRLREAHPDIRIIVTAGNHDSGSRHEVFRIPWKEMGVEMIGNLDTQTPETHIIEIPGKGFVIALPYSNERYIPEGFFQSVIDLVETRNSNGLPVVMMAHTTVTGADFRGHDKTNDLTVGGIDGINVELMGKGYDYLALGHIHHAQFIHSGLHNVRYSGSPIAISFDEDYPHSVSLVTLERHGDTPEVRVVEISNQRPLITLPQEGAADWETALALLRGFPPNQKAYVRLSVESDGPLPPGAIEEAAMSVREKECKFCGISRKRKNTGVLKDKTFTVQEFKELNPTDIALQFAREEGRELDDDMMEMLREAIRSVSEDEQS